MFDPFPFHDAIESNMKDAGLKLVYADALDENGFPTRAAFVRWLGRTGRHPGGIYGSYRFERSRYFNSAARFSTLPAVFDPCNIDEKGATYSHNGEPKERWFLRWAALERYYSQVWAELTAPAAAVGFLSLFKSPPKPWVPDYTPLTPWEDDSRQVALRNWAAGVR